MRDDTKDNTYAIKIYFLESTKSSINSKHISLENEKN